MANSWFFKIDIAWPTGLDRSRNGRLGADELVKVPDGGQLHPLAARAWLAMRAEAAGRGLYLTHVGMYRDYERQEEMFRQRYTTSKKPGRKPRTWNGKQWYPLGNKSAAVPGTSNHGLGLAIDVAYSDTRPYSGGAKSIEQHREWRWYSGTLVRTFGFSFEEESSASARKHIRYVAGDRLPQAVLDHEANGTPSTATIEVPAPLQSRDREDQPATSDSDLPSSPRTHREDDDMRYQRAAKLATNGSWWLGDGRSREWQGDDVHEAKLRVAGGVIDARTAKLVYSWDAVGAVDQGFLDQYLGVPIDTAAPKA